MRIRIKAIGEAVGEVTTNRGMSLEDACYLAGVDAGHGEGNDFYLDDLEMDYTEDVRYQCVRLYGCPRRDV